MENDNNNINNKSDTGSNKPNHHLNDNQLKAIKIWTAILIVITISAFLYNFVTGLYAVSVLLVNLSLPRFVQAYEE